MRLFSLLFLLVFAAGAAAADSSDAPPADDRAAILGMAGEFKVSFHFEETVALQQGYELKKPYTQDANELVVVARDTPGRIELQHLLLSDGEVVKHWRQVWTWQDTRLCEYQGDNTWRMRDLTAEEARGTWSQLVTQVDDSPRYESFGRWQHRAGISSWTSAETWRPLPRRESARSKEYQVIAGTNRHTLTPNGWVHEQDNTKSVVKDGNITGVIAREKGVNTYRRLKPEEKVDFRAARKMWEQDSVFWSQVNDAWADVQRTRPVIRMGDSARLSKLQQTVSDLKMKPAASGQWPVREAIERFLSASEAP